MDRRNFLKNLPFISGALFAVKEPKPEVLVNVINLSGTEIDDAAIKASLISAKSGKVVLDVISKHRHSAQGKK